MKKLRKIRSFVRRQGRMTSSQRIARDVLLPKYGLDPTQNLDYQAIFGRDAPLELEIGFGMGQSLLQMAQAAPERDFIGIEVHWPGIGALLNGIELYQLKNVRLLVGDAMEIIQQAIPDASLDRILIFFPDPWPKQRHQKRRLIQPAFVGLLQQKLKLGGMLHLATDWEDYATKMMAILEQTEGLKNLSGLNQFAVRPPYRTLTKFELRGQLLGHGVWDLLFIKEK